MALCKTCGKKYNKWTTPVSAKGVYTECFQAAPGNGEEAQEEVLLAEDESSTRHNRGNFTGGDSGGVAFEGQIMQGQAEEATEMKWFEQFLPRSRSMLVFIPVATCYSWTAGSVTAVVVRAFHVAPPPIGLFANEHGEPTAHIVDLLFLAPLIETFILLCLIELFRRLRFPAWLQVLLPALVIGILHSPQWWPRGFIVAPSFIIDACAYLYWRSTSRKVAYGVVAAIHALHNSIPAVSVIAYTAWHR